MAVYKVRNDGTAGPGKQPGDLIVTFGGTYEITKVNPDGTYRSKKVGDETPETIRYGGLSPGAIPLSRFAPAPEPAVSAPDDAVLSYQAALAEQRRKLDEQETQIGAAYGAARNRAAVAAARDKQSFLERSYASGLGSGTRDRALQARERAYQAALKSAESDKARALEQITQTRRALR